MILDGYRENIRLHIHILCYMFIANPSHVKVTCWKVNGICKHMVTWPSCSLISLWNTRLSSPCTILTSTYTWISNTYNKNVWKASLTCNGWMSVWCEFEPHHRFLLFPWAINYPHCQVPVGSCYMLYTSYIYTCKKTNLKQVYNGRLKILYGLLKITLFSECV